MYFVKMLNLKFGQNNNHKSEQISSGTIISYTMNYAHEPTSMNMLDQSVQDEL